jgi:hypothetical protein
MVPAVSPGQDRWRRLAYAYALLVSGVLAYFLLGLTVQVSDSFGNLLALQRPSLAELLREQFTQRAYLRPLLWAQLKIVYELADGQYYLWFRGLHAVQVTVLIALCVRLMRPATPRDLALVPLAVAVLTGSHTFAPMLREAFPINSFLTIAICCVAVANLALRPAPRWPLDVLAVVLFVVATLTVESGLLVWVVCVVAYAVGMRGVSRAGVVTMTGCLAVYLVARLIVLDVGTPALSERSSGFGFGIVEPTQLAARFGESPWPFYLYNVAASVLTVLFSEPKGGAFRFLHEVTRGSVHPWSAVSVLSSTLGTGLLAWFVWTRRARLRAWTLEHDDRLVLLFLAVLAANAAISFPYTKNVIMSPAGVFLALAVFAAARTWLNRPHAARLALTAVVLAVLACGWAFRSAGVHHNLRRTAAMQRAEWTQVDAWLDRQRISLESPQARSLRDALRRDAIWQHPTPYQPTAGWTRWFDIDY